MTIREQDRSHLAPGIPERLEGTRPAIEDAYHVVDGEVRRTSCEEGPCIDADRGLGLSRHAEAYFGRGG